MAEIHVMSEALASQVAAGEVVERPASVLKELIENSIDAGAHCITIDIRRGGIALLRVADDGCGMSQEDALLCIKRHATSKITTLEDLMDIHQLGFRGEALPSIASVSRVKISTREEKALEGTELSIDAGELQDIRSSGVAHGTCIEVQDLFFNIPARRKFLKTEETEAAQAEHQIRLHALAFPNIRFILRRDNKLIYDIPPTNDLRVRIQHFIGEETAQKLIPLPETLGPGLCISGFLLPISEARRTRKQQFIFLNKRPIEDPLVSKAIKEGYNGFPQGLHPALFLNIEIEPSLVDVNVHPAKKEVRFRRPNDVATTLSKAVSSALSAEISPTIPKTPWGTRISDLTNNEPRAHLDTNKPLPIPEQKTISLERPKKQSAPIPSHITDEIHPITETEKKSTEREKLNSIISPTLSKTIKTTTSIGPSLGNPLPHPQQRPTVLHPIAPAIHSEQTFDFSSNEKSTESEIPFTFLAVLRKKYFLWEGPEGLVIMNPTAARERIIFEQFLNNRRQENIPEQHLLTPIILEVDLRDFNILSQLQHLFEEAGFQLTPFGRNAFQVESIPAFLELSEARPFLINLVDKLSDNLFARKAKTLAYEAFATELTQRLARRETIQRSDAERIMRELLNCDLPYCTPTNKPTLYPLSIQELNRKFSIH